MKLSTLLIVVLFSSFANAAPIEAVAFTWDAPTTNVDGTELTDLSHYTLKVDELRLTVPKEETSGTVMLDRAIDHRAVVTASDLEGNESDPSNEVLVAQLVPTPTPTESPTPTPTATPGAAPCDECCFLRLQTCQGDRATVEAELVAVKLELKKAEDDLAALQAASAECERVKACIKTKYPLTYQRCQ